MCSSDLPGNLVQVRGFPLGAFSAVNAGKVVNPYTEDSERGWSHADFVVDALLSAGNSGSPVFAVSCHTSEPELVGVFHAGYAEAAALNVVVAIDQLREELETLRLPRRNAGLRSEITAQDRDRVVKHLSADRSHALTFPFGGRAVQVQLSDPGTLRFAGRHSSADRGRLSPAARRVKAALGRGRANCARPVS